MSAISFLLLISGLKKARKLIKYNTHKGLRERLGDDYEIRLGLGLHIGYSIEGAIGSYHKIDASICHLTLEWPKEWKVRLNITVFQI